MTFGFLSGSRNFCKLLWVSCEVLFLHGYAWIHWVARSCTTTAYRWLFRDSQLSLRTLWSAVIKSPKLSARGTASPLRLLHGALVILVRLQISQFRSLGKWVWTLCLPKSSRLFVIGSKEASWEELAWEPPCNGISSSTKFSLNSCSHSGISGSSEHNGLLRSIVVSFLFVFGISLAWISSGCPDLSSTELDTGTGEMSLLVAFSPFSNRQFAYCRWRRWGWGRWWRMTLLFHRCPWSWWRSRGRTWQVRNHDRNEVLGIARYSNPVFDEICGFWPLIHSKEYPFSSQSFPSDNTAGVFSRTFIVKNISNSLTYTIASSCVCTSPLAVMTIVGLHELRQSIHFSFTSGPFCWSCALTLRSPQQTLFPQVSTLMQAGTFFPETRRMLLCFAPLVFNTLLASFPRCFRGHLALATLSLRVNDPQILEHWGYAHEVHLDKCSRARDFCLEFWYDAQ